MFVKPAPNPQKPDTVFRVRRPGTRRLLPESGGNVDDNAYWRRRLMQGDVVEAEAPKEPDPPPEPATHAEAVHPAGEA